MSERDEDLRMARVLLERAEEAERAAQALVERAAACVGEARDELRNSRTQLEGVRAELERCSGVPRRRAAAAKGQEVSDALAALESAVVDLGRRAVAQCTNCRRLEKKE